MFGKHSILTLATIAIALGITASRADAQRATVKSGYPCRDAWVTSAWWDVTGNVANEPTNRAPWGYGDTGECNPRLYGNGSWSSYADLVSKVRAHINNRQSGVCRDPWVTQAVTEVKKAVLIKNNSNFAPVGWGEDGECNMYLYSAGSWSSYADLKSSVQKTLQGWKSNGFAFDWSMNFAKVTFGSDGMVTPGSLTISKFHEVIVTPSQYSSLVSAGLLINAGQVVAGGAGNIVAGGGGNVVAAGAGNVVAGGAGNLTPRP